MKYRPPAFLRTTAFRQTLLSAGLFAFSSFVILGFVYAASAGMMLRRADTVITEELNTVMEQFDAGGISSIHTYMLERIAGGAGDYLYVMVDRSGRDSGSSNLSWPRDVVPDSDGRVQFSYNRQAVTGVAVSDKGQSEARARILLLPGGYRLLIGLDVDEEINLLERMTTTILAASALALALGVAGGIFVSRRFARRLDDINVVARSVKAGDLKQRAPRNFTGDELDELAENFNGMLDRVEALMHRMRHAGDSIAHDLRTPLTRMRNRLDQALLDEGSLESREAALEQAVSDTDELLSVFNSILSLSRLESGESRASIVRMDPALIAVDLAELYEPVCEDENLEFSSEIQGGMQIYADRGLISQALSNLLENSVKYTPSGGTICLRLRQNSAGWIEYSVTDNGPGIPPDDRERALQRFVRLDSSRSLPGTGLGLSLVKAIVDVHNGQIDLADGSGIPEEGGPGLRASLCLPAAPDADND